MPPHTPEAPGAFESRWSAVAGVRWHARVSSGRRPAPALVMVHGLGLSGRYMLPTARLLAPELRVHIPDLPGFGRSGKPPQALTVPDLADALAAWMRVQGLRDAALFGNSLGCQIVAELAVRHPALAGRLILQGPTVDAAARSIVRQMARWVRDAPRERLSQGAIIAEDWLACGPRRFARTLRGMMAHRIERALPGVRAPVLVVRGEHDPIAPERWCEELAALAPRGRLVVVPGGAHALTYAAPLELSRIIRAFVAEDAGNAPPPALGRDLCGGPPPV